jgi:hypothetical protein
MYGTATKRTTDANVKKINPRIEAICLIFDLFNPKKNVNV